MDGGLMNLDLDGISRNPYAAGALGSLVALRFAPGLSWPERCINVLAGEQEEVAKAFAGMIKEVHGDARFGYGDIEIIDV